MENEKPVGDDSYFKFSSFGLKKLANQSLLNVRNKIFNNFMNSFSITPKSKVLDIGVSLDDHEASNYFEKKYPYTNQITAVGIGDYSILESQFPGLKFVQADGRNLPFADNEFDYTYSHAVIEHVGDRQNQRRFILELIRVSRHGVFFTTPNRIHPLEFHTGFPLFHYLPIGITRKIYKKLGKEFYSTEENLNLLFSVDLRKMLNELKVVNYNIESIFWSGFPSNIIVRIFTNAI